MICANCGTQNEAGSRFCDECGAALAVVCANCGESNRPTAKFCGSCGQTLAADAVPPAAPRAVPVTSAAERRLVSVLFIDLVGFTPFAEETDPEAVRETLDRYFGIARLTIERHGGTVEKFIGDAVMAVWGTPTAHEDDAERAVRTALELVDAVRELGPQIEARAAVVTGEAAVNVGASDQALVAGDLVNTASRLQSVAPPRTVLVGEATMHAAEAAISFEPAGEQVLKGKSSPIPAYRALRVVAQRGGQNRAAGLEPPFVGREEELRQLKEMLHATARDQRVRLVSITGPAGIGKSRLAWELEKYADGVVESVYWHRGRSPAYGEGITFWALGEMVRRRAQLAESDDEATTRERIRAVVAEFVPDGDDRAWIERSLLVLLGVEAAPAGGSESLFAAWRMFFEQIAERGTTVLVFEDLQWADDGLLDFLDHVLEWSRNRPLLILTLSRPELYERRPGWGSGQRFFSAMALEPLAEAAMRELLNGVVPGLPERAVADILGRADGIPLYAVEIVRMLVANGQLEATDGAYRPVGELKVGNVPETLRSLISSRLDRLEPEDRSLLQEASVLGQRFTQPALAAVSGRALEDLEPRMRQLVRREFLDLEADPRAPERGQYGFVQSLIREVAYATLARAERRARHLAAARYFEQLGDEELAGALASHYLAAYEASAEGPERDAVGVQARLALRAAAERAAGLGAHSQAITFAQQALVVTSDPAERAALLELAAASADAGADERAEQFARDALALRLETGDPAQVRASTAELGRVLIDLGRVEEAIEAMETALADLPAEATDLGAAALMATLSRAFMRATRAVEAIEVADRALAIAERQNLDGLVAEAMVNKGSSLGNLGRRREARALLEAAVRLATAAEMHELQLRAINNLSVAFYEDDPKAALAAVEEGIAMGKRLGQRGIVHWQTGSAAMYALVIGEDWNSPIELLDEVLAGNSISQDRARALAIEALYGAYRGETGDELEQARVAAEGLSEPQVPGTLEWAQAVTAFDEGSYAIAHKRALAATAMWHYWIPLATPIAVRSAILAGDEKAFETAVSALESNPKQGTESQASALWAQASHAVMEGRQADAAGLFRRSADVYREGGFHLLQAQTIVDAIAFAPDEPKPREWAQEAREILERIGAHPTLERLERALAAAGGAGQREAVAASEPARQRA